MIFSNLLQKLVIFKIQMPAYAASVRAHTVVGKFSVSGGPHEGAPLRTLLEICLATWRHNDLQQTP